MILKHPKPKTHDVITIGDLRCLITEIWQVCQSVHVVSVVCVDFGGLLVDFGVTRV